MLSSQRTHNHLVFLRTRLSFDSTLPLMLRLTGSVAPLLSCPRLASVREPHRRILTVTHQGAACDTASFSYVSA